MRIGFLHRFKRYDLSNASLEFTNEILREYNASRPNGPQPKVCMAPFKSIYFGHYGKAIACCYNRTHILGNYPEDSIREIWFGKEAEALRNHISANNLDFGCQGCKSQILAGNYDATKAKQYDQHRENSNGFPTVMEFELSNVCNLECTMCSGDFSSLIRKNRENRPPLQEPYDEAFVDQLDEFIPFLEEVKFYGGEPFLIEIYYKIWERIIELNPKVRISVQTNGTVLNNRVKRILEKVDFHLNLSIDSLEKSTYQSIRVNANYERVMENLEWFQEYCRKRGTFFGISACAMQQNWRELPSFVTYCNERQIPVYFHTVFFPREAGFHSLDEAALQEIVLELGQVKFPENNPIQRKNKRHFDDTVKQIRHLLSNKRVTRQPDARLETLEDFKAFVRNFAEDYSGWDNQVKVKKVNNILQKVELLDKELGPDYPYKEKLADFDTSNTVGVLTLLNQLESLPKSALLILAKAVK